MSQNGCLFSSFPRKTSVPLPKTTRLTIENWQLTIMALALRTDFRASLPEPYHSERSKASSGLGSPFGSGKKTESRGDHPPARG